MFLQCKRLTSVVTLAALSGCSLFSGQQQMRLNLELAEQQLQMGRYQDARPYLDKSESLQPRSARLHADFGEYYLATQQHDKAGNHFQQALKLDPRNPMVVAGYGSFLCSRGDIDQGIDQLTDAIDSAYNSQPWAAETRLADCFAQHNDLIQSTFYLKKVLNTKSDYLPALLAMQKISYQQHHYQQAHDYWQRYCQLGKPGAESLWLAFQTERALGDAELSAVYRQQLLNEFPDSVQAQKISNAISN